MAETTTDTLEQMAEQIQQLREALAEQQAVIARQQTKIEGLSTQVIPSRRHMRRERGTTSRRALLRWGGAAAAAATVALVASEGQVAHAAPAGDGGSLLIGTANVGTSQTSLAITGSSSASPLFQVDASSSQNVGAQAITGISNVANGTGVYGTSTNGRGVYGFSNFGWGVYGYSGGFIALSAASESGGRILQTPMPTAGPPASSTYYKGEQMRDLNGDLWLCVVGNGIDSGTWVKAAHIPAGYTGGAIAYLSKPIRLLDTRGSDPNALHNGGGPYTAPGSPYTLQIAGVNWMSVTVPSNAVGAIGKLTVISGASGSGFVALVPSGSGTPSTGTLPYGASQIVATSFNVGLGGSPSAIDIYVGGTAVDVVIDLFAVVA